MSKICNIHKRQYISMCTSDKCFNDHAGICSHQECPVLHDHPIRETISIARLKEMIVEGCFPLNQLVEKVKVYFQEMRKKMVEQLMNDQEEMLENIRKHEYCEEEDDYNTLLSIIEERYSRNTSAEIWKLFRTLSDPGRRDRIKTVVNRYQQQLNYKHINRLLNSQLYKEMVLKSFTHKSLSLESNIIKQQSNLTQLLKKCSLNLQYFQRIFSAKESNYSAVEYHKAVNQVSPTLTIIKANNRIFGCYLNTKISLTNTWIVDSSKKSFIFSLDHQTIHPIIDDKRKLAMAAFGGEHGPQIGSGLDIYICDKCNIVEKSASRLGGSYQLPNGIEFRSEEGDRYLAGQKQFLVQDYQVFTMT